MFFYLSKIFWFLASPGNLFLITLILASILLWTRWRNVGRGLIGFLALAGILVSVVPVGSWVNWHLENRFPTMKTLPANVDGIVVAGGVVNQFLSQDRGQPVIGGAIERITAASDLAKRFPNARIIFSGGSGDIFRQDLKEADYVAPIFENLGVPANRIVFESESRNTVENAQISLEIAKPRPDQTWVLVTSAFHMPRAIGTFRKAGWDIMAYPTDYGSYSSFEWSFNFNFIGGLSKLGGALHESLGLLFYWITGKSDALFPKPEKT